MDLQYIFQNTWNDQYFWVPEKYTSSLLSLELK